MSSGLSQAEIDALLRGETLPSDDAVPDASALMADAEMPVHTAPSPNLEMSPSFPTHTPIPNTEGMLSEIEIDTLGEIGNISMGTAATTLFALLSHKVDITTPSVCLTTMRQISEEYPLPFVAVEVQYTLGLEGTNVLFLRETDVKIITDLLMGGDGTNTSSELSELHLSAISEVMNQMVGSSSTSLAKLMGINIDISPPRAFQVNLAADAAEVYPNLDEIIVRTSFDMVVEGLINSQIMQVMPMDFAKRQVSNLLSGGASAAAGMSSPSKPSSAPPPPPPAPQQQAYSAPASAMPPTQQPYYDPYASQGYNQAPPQQQQQPPPGYYDPYQQQQQQQPPPGYYPPPPGYPPNYGYPPPQQQQPMYQQPPQMVDVRPAQFGSFDGSSAGGQFMGENMDLLMDVPLTVSVELGKSTKYIKEILDFNIGTIVVLDKMAGELVDIVVNGKLIAKGEVVVIDDNYGARITDIVSPSKRIGPGK